MTKHESIATDGLSRRRLVISGLSAAGGLMVGVPFAKAETSGFTGATLAGAQTAPKELTAFLIIDPDSSVTIRLPHHEMGQGTSTGLAMLVAEELGCDWSKVKVEHASANRNTRSGGKLYGRMITGGSMGLRTSVKMMQQAGASARERLRIAAAERWKVAATECSIEAGNCLHKATSRALTYGELAPAAALVKLDAEPAIKTGDKYSLVGKWTARLDTAAKIDGSAAFGIDAKVPGMVYAAVVSCPEFGGKLKSVDESAVVGARGLIKVVKTDDAVIVVADRYWRAKSALGLLKIEWADGGNAHVDQAALDQGYRDALDGPLVQVSNEGDVAAALAQPDVKVVEALYEAPNLAHAAMEPLNCTVEVKPDRVDIWIGTQAPMGVVQIATKESGVAAENIYIHNTFMGGGFGRRTQHDEVVHAIAAAKAVGKPVKLIWHREQDIRRDRFRPQAAVRFKGAVARDGKPSALSTQVAVGSIQRSLGYSKVEDGKEAAAVEVLDSHAYKIPNSRVGLMLKNSHVPVMYWRSVGASQNTFFLESFIDEMAHAAGKDPLQFRKDLLAHRPDYLGVLDTLAKRSDWGSPLAPGRGRGIAIVECFGTIAGQVAEVTVSPAGEVKVDRVVSAVDCYQAANPNTIYQQMEGGIIWGLTAALYGDITIKDGAPVQANFNNYRLLRMAETPKIETYLSLSGGPTWGGIGEPSAAPIAPAVTNAIFAATGKRLRKLPIKAADLKTA